MSEPTSERRQEIRHEVRRISILSAVKTMFVLGGVLGFVGGFLQWFFLQGIMSYSYSATMQGDVAGMPGLPDVMGLIGSLAWILPLVGGAAGSAIGIVTGVVVALFYNLAARIWGGLEIELRESGGLTTRAAVIPVTRKGETTPLPTPMAPIPKDTPTSPPAPSGERPSASHFFE